MNEMEPPEGIRVGSPFAVDSPRAKECNADDAIDAGVASSQWGGAEGQSEQTLDVEAFYAAGPLRYTARGALGAACLVMVFATAALWWFPGGGMFVAAWGCVLSMMGMYSKMPKRAIGCLLVNALLFFLCYARTFMA